MAHTSYDPAAQGEAAAAQDDKIRAAFETIDEAIRMSRGYEYAAQKRIDRDLLTAVYKRLGL